MVTRRRTSHCLDGSPWGGKSSEATICTSFVYTVTWSYPCHIYIRTYIYVYTEREGRLAPLSRRREVVSALSGAAYERVARFVHARLYSRVRVCGGHAPSHHPGRRPPSGSRKSLVFQGLLLFGHGERRHGGAVIRGPVWGVLFGL